MNTYRSLRFFVHAISASALATAVAWASPAAADWSPDDPPQDIVITLKSSPKWNPEAACLAVTLARVLIVQGKANVTLFPTLDGVALGDSRVVAKRRLKCDTPFSPDPIPLEDNLEAFLSSDAGDMVICPLCWTKRYDKYPDYGFLPQPCEPGSNPPYPDGCDAVVQILMNADKVIDF
jgi:hypothetical protein